MDIKAAVKELRKALGDTQQQFAARLKLAISTVVRYELSREPKGAMLIQFHNLAVEQGRQDLAQVFWDAAAAELGQVGIQGVSDIWSKALTVRNRFKHNHATVEDLVQALTDIANMCVEINPALQWQAGDHLEAAKKGTKARAK